MENENKITDITKEPAQECVGSFNEAHKTSMHIGNTTYLVGIHFGKDEKESLEEKVKSLIMSDIRNGKIV